MPRLRIVIAYDGAPFAGWQSQTHRNTIQDHIERAFERVSRQQIRVHGAGRTDAGVHALGQCAHVDLPDTRLPPERWTSALNASLPPEIRVLRCRYVSKDFHARFSAKGKLYRYRIWTSPVLVPHEYKRAWHIKKTINFSLLTKAGGLFVGKHNFAAFAANRGHPEHDTLRTLHSVRVRRSGPCASIDFDGDGFLYKMVRLMVGAMTEAASGKLPIEEIAKQLETGKPVSKRVAAPADGLFLVRIRY
jgi:tRNA pseudouridine38-40 synthase